MEKKSIEKAESVRIIKESKRLDLLRQKLSNPIQYKWPQLTDDIDHQIQLRLQRAFEPYRKCLRRVKKIHDDGTCETPPLSRQEAEEKRNFKKLFCLGISNVLKHLERDQLRLVLIWKATQPSELKKAVLSLVAMTGCPAASISDVLHPVKVSFPALSSLTAMGIMKSSSPNVFDDLVQYVKLDVPRIEIPELPKTNRHTVGMDLDSAEKPTPNIDSQKVVENKSGTLKDSDASNSDQDGQGSAEKAKVKDKGIDWFKYDIHKPDKTGFGDGDFIKFSADISSKLIQIDKEMSSSQNSLGIAVPLNIPDHSREKQEERKLKRTGKKRKLDKSNADVKSSYKEISIKHFKSNPNKRKKKMFKNRKMK